MTHAGGNITLKKGAYSSLPHFFALLDDLNRPGFEEALTSERMEP